MAGLSDYLNQQQQKRNPAPRASSPKAPPRATFAVPSNLKSGGPRFSQGGPIQVPKPPQHSGGGGFLHGVGSFLGSAAHDVAAAPAYAHNKIDLAAHDIQAMPAGFVKIGEASAHDAAKFATLVPGTNSPSARKLGRGGWQLPGVGKAIVKGGVTSIEHPARDPFQTLLTAGAIASAGAGLAARGAAAGSELGAAGDASIAERLGAAGKALAKKPEMPNRILRAPALLRNKAGDMVPTDTKFQITASQRPVARGIQAIHDKIVQRSLDKYNNIEGKSSLIKRYGDRRISHANTEITRRTENIDQGLPMQIQHVGARRFGRSPYGPLSKKEGEIAMALRSWQVLPHEYHAALEREGAFHADTPRANDLMDTLQSLHDKGVLQMKGDKVAVNGKLYPHLARADKLAKLGQKARNAIIKKYGLMSPEGMANREALPAEVIRGEAARSSKTGVREGDGYTPLKLSQKDLPRFPRPAGQSGGVIGVPKNFVEKSMPATGEGVRTGFIPDNTTAGIARATKQAFTYKSKMDARDRAYSGGSDVSRHANDILIRDPKVAAKALKTSTKQALKQELSTMDTVGSEQGLYDNFLSYMHDVTHPQKAGTAGVSAPKGTRWVSKDTVGDLGKSVGPRSKLAQAADTLNSGVTAATVYAKPSHVPQRFVTDATTSALSGALTSLKTRAFVKALRNGGLDERQLMESQQATGTHGYLALPHEGSNLAAHAATKGANFFANHVDARFRFMNLAHEARKAGIDSVPEFKKMLSYAKDPSKRIKIADAQKYEQVLRRSDRVSMMYDGLTPTERATVSRALWFYPWMKAATRYGGHVMAEHPLAAGVGANVGAYGRKVQRKELGALPSFEYGLIPFNHGHTTSSAGWLWPFNTTGQVAELGARPQQIIGNLNPATQAGLTAISGLNSFGDTVPGGRGYPSLKEAASEMFAPTPEASILKDYLDKKSAERKTHMFPHSPSTDFFTRLLVGPSYPKVTNKKALHKAAQREGGKGYDLFIPKK